MNQIPQLFKKFIAKEDLFNTGTDLLIAVSGGVDSIVLCELCKRGGFSFNIAHCNFTLRGEESEGDALFVRELAAGYGVAYFEKIFNTKQYAETIKVSIQVAARDLRYEWFKSLTNPATGKPFEKILTAHHADDNMETIAMNFFKGTGIRGLKGILPKTGRLVRPLLFAKKEALVTFATENRLAFREDSSNQSAAYTRNFFRNTILPVIEKVYPAAGNNLVENAEKFRDIQSLYEIAVDVIVKKLVTNVGDEIHIPVVKLTKTPAFSTILYEIIMKYGFTALQTGEAIKLIKSDSGKFIQSSTHRILHNRKWLIISKLERAHTNNIIIEKNEKEIFFQIGVLKISESQIPVSIVSDTHVAQLDISGVEFPLLLRKWKTGDYFYPLGMVKKKKLSRFFIDQKLSLNEKSNTWVIESNKKILWVVGMRIDNRFKVTQKTTALLQINWLPSK
ncbi:MAG: tRNA lysidine(34) synthetase TilS [Ferruginibacter sp.]